MEIPVYISLTTLPDRITHRKTQRAIQSILHGEVLPKKIILNIPLKTMKGQTYSPSLFKYPVFKNPRVVIHHVEEDMGPILKLDGGLRYLQKNNLESSHIILIDDDIVYPPNLLKLLWNKHFQHPHSSLGFAGRTWNPENQKLVFKAYYKHNIYHPGNFTYCHLLETFHMVIHPTDIFLNHYDEWKSFLNETFVKSPKSIFTDDIVISLWLREKKIHRIILKGPRIKIITGELPKLSDINCGNRGNNQSIFKDIFYKEDDNPFPTPIEFKKISNIKPLKKINKLVLPKWKIDLLRKQIYHK